MATKRKDSKELARWRRRDLHRRAGIYSKRTGAAKNVARAQALTRRRIQQINAGGPPGVPQATLDWLDRLADGRRTNPYPLIVMLIERVEERMASGDPAERRARWIELCDRETRKQGKLDLRQLALRARSEMDPDAVAEHMEAFVDVATAKVESIMEMVGLARAELEAQSQ